MELGPVLGKRKPLSESIDTLAALRQLEKRACQPKYCAVRSRLVDIWNGAHCSQIYDSMERLLDAQRDACIPFFIDFLKASEYSNETRKTYLNALKQLGCDQFSVNGLKLLDASLRSFRTLIMEKELQNECDDVEDANWLPWKDIVRLYDDFTCRMFVSSGEDPYDVWQCYLLFSLYVLQPPLRHNFGHVLLNPPPSGIQYPHLTSYIDLDAETPFIYVSYDKVFPTYGAYSISLDPTLVMVIQAINSKFEDRKYLLTKPSNPSEALETSDYVPQKTNTNRLWKRLSQLVGHPLNLCMLRSSYATYVLDQTHSEAELLQIARCMRTSVGVMRSYYKKIKVVQSLVPRAPPCSPINPDAPLDVSPIPSS